MRALRTIAISILTCCACVACASAPISVVGSEFTAGEPVVSAAPEQVSLRTATQSLESAYENRGWSHATGAMQAAQNWIGRLAGRGEDDNDVSVDYVEAHGLLELDSEAAIAVLETDLYDADMLARNVDEAALAVSQAGSEYSRASLTQDLGHVERAIAHTRQALASFDIAISRLGSRLSPMQLEQVRTWRDQLAQRSESLRDRADAIADMRRYVRHRAFS